MDKSKIDLKRRDIESGILELIQLHVRLMEQVNKNSAYGLKECEERIKLIHQRNNLDTFLRMLGIQTIDYDETTLEVEIR